MTRRAILVGLSLVLAAGVAFGLGKATAGDEQTQSPGIEKLKLSGVDAQVPTLARPGSCRPCVLGPRQRATNQHNGIAPTDPGTTDPGITDPEPRSGTTDPGDHRPRTQPRD